MGEGDKPMIRVLIVDDHALVAESLGLALGDEDDLVVVGRAATSAGAIAQTRALRPDVVVLDHGLPDCDGIETARLIVGEHPQTRIVMLTGSGVFNLQRRAGEAGCVGFVTKDCATADLVAAVRAAAKGHPMGVAPPRTDAGSDLTDRELEILDGIVRGLDNRAIAAELYLSVHTVRNHMQRVLHKLGAHSKLEAAASARRFGLVGAAEF
jgi:DNA-binding NarL/FixJ family response regulator